MDIKTYQQEAEATKSNTFIQPGASEHSVAAKASIPTDILHAIIGISTEGGELLDVVKKAMFYAKPVDYVNLDEEIGDVLWYIAIYCNARGTTIEDICKTNNEKLKARFPDKFTTYHANNRDLEKERKILENGSK